MYAEMPFENEETGKWIVRYVNFVNREVSYLEFDEVIEAVRFFKGINGNLKVELNYGNK